MMNKKGFELSINFIVMLIITLIVFAGSLMIASKLLSSMDNLKASMDRQTQERLESMITSGNEEVIVAFSTKQARGGEAAVFGMGVLNTLNAERNFSLNITPSIGVYKNGSSFPFDGAGWLYIKNDSIGSIKNNAHTVKSLVVIPPKNIRSDTTYVFDVKVSWIDAANVIHPYPARDPTKKIRVTVI